MKRILITGKNSYVGNSFENWLRNFPEKYKVEKISLRDDSWKDSDFSRYDTILHVAGIAHIKETKLNKSLYYKVNCDLAYEVAKKAKNEAVKHFIFLSSMSVYGIETGVITPNTVPKPKSNYGKSKLEAEKLIGSLNDDLFKVAILRPPMIYGKGCKGNYSRLVKLAVKSPIFPDVDNKRSMIFIDNLSIFMKTIIDNYSWGLFFPQNSEYVNTSKLVQLIATKHGKKIRLTKLFNPFFFIVKGNSTVNKVFGTLVYEKNTNDFDTNRFISFEQSINLTEDLDEKGSNTL